MSNALAQGYSITWAYTEAQVEDAQRTRARKVERTWRGDITPERIARDHTDAQIEDAARRVLSLRTAADLDGIAVTL